MSRLLLCSVLLSISASASAQDVFIAPTGNTVTGSTDQSNSPDGGHILYVENESSVPIIVFGVVLRACENVKQWCGSQRTNITIPPGTKRTVGRVDPKSTERSWNYRWTFSYRADSSDAKIAAILREHGLLAEAPSERVIITRKIDTTAPPDIEKPLSREPLTAEERSGLRIIGRADSTPIPAFRFKVFYGSVLGSTMMPGAPIQATGPCINPAESAAYERDARITRTPWRPPELSRGFGQMTIPIALRDSLTGKELLVRFVTDSTGETLPGSVNILESPNGTVSVRVCQTTIASKATPARDKSGRAVRAWVQVPIHLVP